MDAPVRTILDFKVNEKSKPDKEVRDEETYFTKYSFVKIISKLSQKDVLQVCFSSKLLKKLCIGLRLIKNLNLYRASRILTFENFKVLAESSGLAQCIESLSLAAFENDVELMLKLIPNHFCKLKNLDLTKCRTVDYESVRDFLLKMPGLRYLELYKTKVTESEILILKKEFPNVRFGFAFLKACSEEKLNIPKDSFIFPSNILDNSKIKFSYNRRFSNFPIKKEETRIKLIGELRRRNIHIVNLIEVNDECSLDDWGVLKIGNKDGLGSNPCFSTLFDSSSETMGNKFKNKKKIERSNFIKRHLYMKDSSNISDNKHFRKISNFKGQNFEDIQETEKVKLVEKIERIEKLSDFFNRREIFSESKMNFNISDSSRADIEREKYKAFKSYENVNFCNLKDSKNKIKGTFGQSQRENRSTITDNITEIKTEDKLKLQPATCNFKKKLRENCWGKLKSKLIYSTNASFLPGTFPIGAVVTCQAHRNEELNLGLLKTCDLCRKLFPKTDVPDFLCKRCADHSIFEDPKASVELSERNGKLANLDTFLRRTLQIYQKKNFPENVKLFKEVDTSFMHSSFSSPSPSSLGDKNNKKDETERELKIEKGSLVDFYNINKEKIEKGLETFEDSVKEAKRNGFKKIFLIEESFSKNNEKEKEKGKKKGKIQIFASSDTQQSFSSFFGRIIARNYFSFALPYILMTLFLCFVFSSKLYINSIETSFSSYSQKSFSQRFISINDRLLNSSFDNKGNALDEDFLPFFLDSSFIFGFIVIFLFIKFIKYIFVILAVFITLHFTTYFLVLFKFINTTILENWKFSIPASIFLSINLGIIFTFGLYKDANKKLQCLSKTFFSSVVVICLCFLMPSFAFYLAFTIFFTKAMSFFHRDFNFTFPFLIFNNGSELDWFPIPFISVENVIINPFDFFITPVFLSAFNGEASLVFFLGTGLVSIYIIYLFWMSIGNRFARRRNYLVFMQTVFFLLVYFLRNEIRNFY